VHLLVVLVIKLLRSCRKIKKEDYQAPSYTVCDTQTDARQIAASIQWGCADNEKD
jgi:hypothetical protein